MTISAVSRSKDGIVAIWIGVSAVRIVKDTEILVKGHKEMLRVTGFREEGKLVTLLTSQGDDVDPSAVLMADSTHEQNSLSPPRSKYVRHSDSTAV